jgi:hypothetical protein
MRFVHQVSWFSSSQAPLFHVPISRPLQQNDVRMMPLFFMPHPCNSPAHPTTNHAPHGQQTTASHEVGIGLVPSTPSRRPEEKANTSHQDPASASKQHQRPLLPQDNQQDEGMQAYEQQQRHQQQQQQQQLEKKHEAGGNGRQQDEQEEEPHQQKQEESNSHSEGQGKGKRARKRKTILERPWFATSKCANSALS